MALFWMIAAKLDPASHPSCGGAAGQFAIGCRISMMSSSVSNSATLAFYIMRRWSAMRRGCEVVCSFLGALVPLWVGSMAYCRGRSMRGPHLGVRGVFGETPDSSGNSPNFRLSRRRGPDSRPGGPCGFICDVLGKPSRISADRQLPDRLHLRRRSNFAA